MRWDTKEGRFVPKTEKDYAKPQRETVGQRRLRLGTRFNPEFEYCPHADSTDMACNSCNKLVPCSDYWVETYKGEIIIED